MPRSPGTAIGLVLIALAVTFVAPFPASSQSVATRSPNVSGGWTTPSGAARFHIVHRFRTVDAGETKVIAFPTFLLAAPVTDRILVGANWATNSFLSSGRANEAELFARWALPEVTGPMAFAVTGAYNRAAESLDAELSARLPISLSEALFLDGIDLLGTARGFSNALATGASGWAFAGAILFRRGNLTLAGDFGSMGSDEVEAESAWGFGLQLQIPATPHSLSIHATNTRTATLQGSSVGSGTAPGLVGPRQTYWGFEFTVPLTYARLFPRGLL